MLLRMILRLACHSQGKLIIQLMINDSVTSVFSERMGLQQKYICEIYFLNSKEIHKLVYSTEKTDQLIFVRELIWS